MYEEHHHHEHEHAEHAHEEEAKAESDDRSAEASTEAQPEGRSRRSLTKLRILLPHWIEHNEEHAASFERWVAKARELGREETAQRIEEAVGRMAACNQALTAALEALEG